MNLTRTEQRIMEIFWEADNPLTTVEIEAMKTEPAFGRGTVFRMVDNLIKKGLLTECGTKRYGRQYARQLTPAMTKEDYEVQSIATSGVSIHTVSKVMSALVEDVEDQDKEDIIRQLEDIIKQLQEEA